MMLFNKTIRGFFRLTGKLVTFIFALYCVTMGLFDGVSAATVTGTVCDRVSFFPIDSIQVVMSEMMCPLYGIGLPCVQGRAIDTAVTGTNGQFQFPNSTASMVYFTLTDLITASPVTYQTRILSKSITSGNAGVIYMLPKNSPYQVKEKVFGMPDSLPIKGVKADLCSYSVTYNGGITPILSEKVIATGYSDQAGQVTFSLDTVMTSAIINVSDIDSSGNGGTFLPASSRNFNAFDDTSTIRIYMEKYSASVVNGATRNVQANTATPLVKRGIVEFRVPQWQGHGQAEAIVVDSRGKIVARPVVSAIGLLQWDAGGLSRGVYFVKAPSGRGMPGLRIFLP
jgi:hypothetical protein